MLIKNIVARVNTKLAGELLTYSDIQQFLDSVIDDINEKLNACYPAFSELENYDTDYNFFPEKYIRSVIIPGAAWYYYVMDEEGISAAQQYQMDYNRALFIMQRDMLYNVPLEYQVDAVHGELPATMQGAVQLQYETNSDTEIDFRLGEW